MTNLRVQHLTQLQEVFNHYEISQAAREDLKHLFNCASDDYMDFVRASRELDGPEIYAKLVEMEDFLKSKVIFELPAR